MKQKVHLLKVHNNPTLLHHWILFIVLHQVCQCVELLPSTHVILHILYKQAAQEDTNDMIRLFENPTITRLSV